MIGDTVFLPSVKLSSITKQIMVAITSHALVLQRGRRAVAGRTSPLNPDRLQYITSTMPTHKSQAGSMEENHYIKGWHSQEAPCLSALGSPVMFLFSTSSGGIHL